MRGSDIRVLVTGGNGFVGQHLVSKLLTLAEMPDIVIGSLSEVLPEGRGRPRHVKLDVTDFDQVSTTIGHIKPTHIVNLAAIAAPTGAQRDQGLAWKVNADGAVNVALASLKTTPQPRLIHASSSDVYGMSFRSGTPLDENAPLAPVSVYGATKAAADQMIGQMCTSGLLAVRLRLFNHTGPGQSEEFVVPALSAQVARIEYGLLDPVIRVGDLSAQRDFLGIEDVIDAYVATIRHFDELPPGCVLNIASGRSISIKAILDDLLSYSDTVSEVEIDLGRFRTNEIPISLGNAKRAEKLLGWAPKLDFHRVLLGVLDDFRRRVRLPPT